MKFIQAVVFSISSVLAATSVFAAPYDHQPQSIQQHKAAVKADQHKSHVPQKHEAKKADHTKAHAPKPVMVKKGEQPKRDWKVGTQVPVKFQAKQFKTDYKQSKKLTSPKANQTWIKVNGDYVLIDTKTHKVLKIVG